MAATHHRRRGHIVHRANHGVTHNPHIIRSKGHIVHHHKNTASGGAVPAASKGGKSKLPQRGKGGRFVKTKQS